MRQTAVVAILAVMLIVPGREVRGQVEIGPTVSIGNDVDFGLGGIAAFSLDGLHYAMEGIVGVDVFFPDFVDYWELYGGVRYMLDVDNPDIRPFLLGGIGIGSISGEGLGRFARNTEIGLKVGGGVKFNSDSRFRPFADIVLNLVGDLVGDFVLRGGGTIAIGG